MIAPANPNPTGQIRPRELDQFRQSIESWERDGRGAGRDGDAELAAEYAEDVADVRAILRLIEAGALHEVTEAITRLGFGILVSVVERRTPAPGRPKATSILEDARWR